MPLDNLEINEAIAVQFAQLVLDCIEREYPNSILRWAESDEDIKPPRQIDSCFLWLLRLAFGRTWSLVAGTSAASLS